MKTEKDTIPEFDERGNLPAGIHWATLDDVIKRFSSSKSMRRAKLGKCLVQFISLVNLYAQEIYIDGSYTTSKLAPGDIDLIIVLSIASKQDLAFQTKFLALQRNFDDELHIFFRFENAPFPDQDIYEYFQITKAKNDQNGHIHAKGIISLEMKNDKK